MLIRQAFLVCLFFLSFSFYGCVDLSNNCLLSPNNYAEYQNITYRAVTENNPMLCETLGCSADDACEQEYYERKNDSSVCEKLPAVGVKQQCRDYFRDKNSVS